MEVSKAACLSLVMKLALANDQLIMDNLKLPAVFKFENFDFVALSTNFLK